MHPPSSCSVLAPDLCHPSLVLLFLLYCPVQVLSSKNEIEMWGDGKQTRSFTYIDDCVEGILRVTKSDFREPLNLGSSEMVSMNEMMQIAMSFEDKVGQGDRGVRGGRCVWLVHRWVFCGPGCKLAGISLQKSLQEC